MTRSRPRHLSADLLGLSALFFWLIAGSVPSTLMSSCAHSECAPGSSQTCAGAYGCIGSQMCSDGTWETCLCDLPAVVSSSTGDSAPSGSSSGLSNSSASAEATSESRSTQTSVATSHTTQTSSTAVAQTSTGSDPEPPHETPPSETCVSYTASQTSGFSLPIVYRDFIGADQGGHEDFETFPQEAVVQGIVDVALSAKGPRFVGEAGVAITSAESFDSWFQDNTDVNIHINDTLNLTASQDAFTYQTDRFFPIDDKAQVALQREETKSNQECGGLPGEKHNFSFTSELRFWFDYTGDEELTFEGDDDVWIFINNRLVVDFGGVHELVRTDPPFVIDDEAQDTSGSPLALEVGQRYQAAVFHAERRSCGSNYTLTLSGFKIVEPNCE